MAEKKRRIDVMVSSTTKDLAEHRKNASNSIQRLRWTPLAMEFDEAKPGEDAISYSLKLVDEAEVYLGIFGIRYGFQPDDTRNPVKISITEMEYRRAVERDIPILIFINTETHPFPASLTADESDADRKKLKRFKDELGSKHIVSFYDSPEELRFKVSQSLYELRASDEFIAKYTEIEEEAVDDTPKKPSLPKPPERYYNPVYNLTTEFIGRSDELGRIDAWATSDDPMMIVEAIGGMGKSAVTWQWLQSRADKIFKPDGVIWWSFYERGATMRSFIRYALAYLTGQDPDALKGRDVMENFKELQTVLNNGRYLIVLDGLERVLVAYHRWNAAQMRDDSIEDAESIIKDRDLRTCTDPKDEQLIQGLLTCKNSKILMSSRLIPLATENRAGNLSKGVRHIHLNGLHEEDALRLVRSESVTVQNEEQFKTFMTGFGYHSLLVTLIAGRVNKFRRARGDFDAWYAQEGRTLTVTDFDVRQSQSHVLKYAFEGLEAEQDRFLSQIAAFGDAIEYDTMTVFNPFAKPAPIPMREPYSWASDEEKAQYEQYQKDIEAHDTYLKSKDYQNALAQFDGILDELEQRGLLRWDREKDRYDMHPVVRGYAFDRLGGDTKTGTFERIGEHFKAQPDDDVESAREVADFSNTIAIYRALLGADKLDQAAQFFENRLHDQLHQHIAAYYTIIELLTPLFMEGTDKPPTIQKGFSQTEITRTMGSMFYYIGRKQEGLNLFGLTLKLDLDEDNASNLCVGLLNYAISLSSDNQLSLAERAYELALILATAINNSNQIAFSRLFLLSIYKDTGQWQEAEETYQLLQEHPPREIYWQSEFERHYAVMLIMRGQDADEALNQTEKLGQQGRNAETLRQLKRWRGEVALNDNNSADTISYFEDALKDARQQGSVEVATYLACLARAYASIDEEKARQYAEEALGQTYKMEEHDMYSSLAEAYLTMDDKDLAKQYALEAYKWAWADGEPFSWWWGLKRSKAVLDALGEPYPDMPAYDESKIGKIAHEDEIRAYIRKKGGDA